jgi:DNA-binding CsgD family transcriptional regulator
MRVSFAAHATHLDGRWHALFVVLSAQPEAGGEQLIAPVAPIGRESAVAAPTGSVSLRLTPREREIVRRVALGRSTPQIAEDLNVSPATIRSHVRNAMVKTGAHTRAQLVALVLGEGLAGE